MLERIAVGACRSLQMADEHIELLVTEVLKPNGRDRWRCIVIAEFACGGQFGVKIRCRRLCGYASGLESLGDPPVREFLLFLGRWLLLPERLGAGVVA